MSELFNVVDQAVELPLALNFGFASQAEAINLFSGFIQGQDGLDFADVLIQLFFTFPGISVLVFVKVVADQTLEFLALLLQLFKGA